ncbi:related to UV-damaged DNA-binding protein [Ustilago trichophora]|uniref:Related to UV-damaged DNA-binding protein n=1 Tax=Ustilago trichophora TaxID=86804 RepID=A0A5C3E437_9BASI|nr:related to UV-damaged DNA-binding protein [Ustilago trichophora]
MLYVAHAYEPSAILQTLVLPSFLPTGPCLAVLKHSSVEFLSLAAATADATSANAAAGLLETVQTVTVHARILAAQAVTDPSSAQANNQALLILTDHYQPRLISLAATLNPQNGEVVIKTVATLALDEVARSPAESALSVWIEPFSSTTHHVGQRVALSHVYKGILKVVPLSASATASGSRTDQDQDEIMNDVSQPNAHSRAVQFSQSFGVRLPHPNLLSCAMLSPIDTSSVPAVALLSQSSVPSKIPGFGEPCLPVLSFHSVDVATQDLLPLPWGPPRKPPRSVKDESDDKHLDPQSSSAATQASRDVKTSQKDDKSSTRKKHGPAAMGSKATANDLRKREEEWAKTDLVQCHVPLPFADALGAHLIHALPAHVGGGVLVFSESSILYVPPPANPPVQKAATDSSAQTATLDVTTDTKGKRRKASEGGAIETRRRSSGAQSQQATAKAVDQGSISTTPSNENGKRRRSSVVAPSSSAGSPSKTSASSQARPRLLRVGLPHPVQVVSVVNMEEPTQTQTGSCKTFSVLFGCSSGALNVLRLTLPENNDGDAQMAASFSASPHPKSIRVETLGTTSQPAGPHALSYLGDGLVCVGSATGDSCLYKILEQNASDDTISSLNAQLVTPPSSPTQSRRWRSSQAAAGGASSSRSTSTELPCGGSLLTLETWQNLGPVVDFVVDDGAGGDPSTSSSAQARIVTCSGAGPSGSIREVRSGASIQDISSLPIPNAQDIWSVHAGSSELSKYTVGLLVGFATSTAYLEFDGKGDLVDVTDRLEKAGAKMSVPTLAAATVLDTSLRTLLVRVAGNEASLLRFQDETLTLLHQWTPPVGIEITTASVNPRGQLVMALSDKSLLYLTVEGGALNEVKKIQLDHEVSCLDISCLVSGQAAQFLACGFWQTRTVQVFSLPDLSPVGQSSVVQQSFTAVPRSVLLHRFTSNSQQSDGGQSTKASISNRDAFTPHLLIGLGDGNLISFALNLPNPDSFSRTVGLSDHKTVSLGTQSLKLSAIFTSTGAHAVAVSGSRPTLIYADAKRFSYNSLRHKDQRSVATLYSGPERAFCAFALAGSVQLASIGALKQQDVRTFPLGLDQPLAIAQWPSRKVFAVCTWTFLPRGSSTEMEKPRGAVRIMDQITLETLDEIRLDPDERPNCITVLRAQGHEMLVVGTGFVSADAQETTSGRLIGYDVSPLVSLPSSRTKSSSSDHISRRLKTLFSHPENGNVYSLQPIRHRLAAAVNSEVKLYSIVDPRPHETIPAPRISVRQRGSWASSFIACNLAAVVSSVEDGKEEDRVIVGDALRSMNVLKVDGISGRLSEIARDCEPFWTSAVESLEEEVYVGADVGFNLFTSHRVPLGEEVKARLRRGRERESERSIRASDSARGKEQEYAHVMERKAVWHYGDMINKFARTSLVPTTDSSSSNSAISPRLMFCTAAGAIGVIAIIRDAEADLLARVERNITTTILNPPPSSSSLGGSAGVVGNISHTDWRTLRTDHRISPPRGVLDGKILQMFIDGRLNREEKEKVVQGVKAEVEVGGVERESVEQMVEMLSQIV